MKVDSLQTMGVTQVPYNAYNLATNAQGIYRSEQGIDSISASSVIENKGNSTSLSGDPLSVEKSRGLLEQANALLKLSNSDIEFKLDDASGKAVFYIKDATSGEVLRQIPNEAMLRLSQNIDQFLEGASQLSGTKGQTAILSGLLTDTSA